MEEEYIKDVTEENQEPEPSPPKVNIIVSEDKMTAYARVTLSFEGQPVTEEQIMEEIEAKSIEYGILHSEIKRFCEKRRYFEEPIVAKGLRPVKGDDGYVEFHFRKKGTGMAKEREDGTVDFKNLDIIENVKAGDTLCTIIHPTEGTDGINVFGNSVKAEPGNAPRIPTGNRIRLSEDSKYIYAEADGGISCEKNVIIIQEIYTVDDVGPATGNIDFNGSVVIRGSVLEGFSVTAKNDIKVRGIVEGAFLNAGGNILLSSGSSGMGKAVITAEGNVTSKFIENTKVNCGGDMCADVILNGDISAGGSVVLKGRKGAIIGGVCKAGQTIKAKSIGNDSHIKQSVMIDPCWYELEKRDNPLLVGDPEEKKKSLDLKRRSMLDFLEKEALREKYQDKDISPEERKKKMVESLAKKTQIKAAIAKIDEAIQEIEEFWGEKDFSIICYGEVYPGTEIAVGNVKMRVNQSVQNRKFYSKDGEIAMGDILPHERG